MFSVGATPFNSRDRQIYGGWTPEQAGDNLYALRKAYEMRAKYSTDPNIAVAAKNWMRSYRRLQKSMPGVMRAALNRSRKALGFQKYRIKPMTPEQKQAILDAWELVDINDKTPEGSYKRKLFSSTYPPYGFMIQYPDLQRPRQDIDPAITGYALTPDQLYTVGPSMATNFFENAAQRKAFFADPANARFKPIRIPRGTVPVTDEIRAMLRAPGVSVPQLRAAIQRVKDEDEDM